MSFIPVRWFMSEKYAREKVGAIAIDLVNNTLRINYIKVNVRGHVGIPCI